MIGDLKPYADYRDSGQHWLGSIPAHWGLLRAKRLFREVDERSNTGKEELLSVSHLTGVTPRRLKNVTMFMAESNVGHKVCRPGDLVINTLWAWMAALGVTRHTGIVSPAYGVYRLIDGGGMLPAYADYLLRTPLYAAEYQRRSTGVNSSRLRLYPEQFLRMTVLLPPPDEQAAIVRFLAWANGRLDRAIRAKRKVIALLMEQKQANMQRRVSHGLNDGVPSKPSGIPWLGDIPIHWRTSRLKHCISRIEQGWSPQCDAQPAGDGEWGVLKVGCVNRDTFSPGQNKKLPDSLRPEADLEVRDGDILVSRANTTSLLGLAALVNKPRSKLMLSDKLFRFRAKADQFDSAYLVAALRAGVVVLFVQIGALCSENPLHDKHLRFGNFQALRILRADWCASFRPALRGPHAAVSRDLPDQTSSLRSRNSSLNCQPSKVATMRPSSSQEISRPSMTTIGTRWSSSGSLSTVPRKIRRSFTCGP